MGTDVYRDAWQVYTSGVKLVVPSLLGGFLSPIEQATALIHGHIGQVLRTLAREDWETYRTIDGELLYDIAAAIARQQRDSSDRASA